jgi:putative Mg2+ transporter-C (MgtC) family protein
MEIQAEDFQVLLAVAYAMLLGGVIGVERELSNRPAGFRTHMLVAGASAFLVGTGWLAMHHAEQMGANGMLQMDPLRLIEAVVAGVAFIGAGTIFASRDKGHMVGITTAASLLMVASIGIAAGLGRTWLALLVTVMTLAVLSVLRGLERYMNRKPTDDDGRSSHD